MWPREGEQLITDPGQVTLPPYLPDTPKARAALARHYDNLARADERAGQILAELEQDGLADQTIVFLWSDHGEGLPRGKRWPYDAGIRIPLIVRWPAGAGPSCANGRPGELTAGSVREDLVSLVDLAPTVLSLAGVEIPRHLHGRPFLGPRAGEPRQYIYAARDRHDEAYDMVRAVRDPRYKYLRNFRPELPYLLWIPYRNRHPVMQEMWRLHGEGKLEGPQTLLFQDHRPVEELYDTQTDPYEINNLAHDPAHRDVLERMRSALDDWRGAYGDLGDISEEQMRGQMWPGGRQPKTAAPVFIPITPAQAGLEVTDEGGAFDGPLLVQLHSATQGASIAYTTQQGGGVRWRLYTGPLRLGPGATTLRAKAIRYGYAESDERTAHFTVRAAAGGGS
jgi:hypothetical protein